MPHLRNDPCCRAFTIMLLLCVLAMRVTVPQGYMWSAEGKGWPAVVLCSGHGAAPVAMQMQMHGGDAHHGQHDHKPADHPCGFAAAGAAVDLAALPQPPVVPTARTATVATFHRASRPGLGLAAPPPPQTGPPSPI